jgi:hypothetical protein
MKHTGISLVSDLQLPARLFRPVLPDAFEEASIIFSGDLLPQMPGRSSAGGTPALLDPQHGGAADGVVLE